MEETKRHFYYIDTLRVISAVGVIFMHTAAAGLRAGVLDTAPYVTRGWHLMNLLTCFAFTAVPLFFMISGYLLFSDEKTKNVSRLFRRRLPRLVVPLAVWTLLCAGRPSRLLQAIPLAPLTLPIYLMHGPVLLIANRIRQTGQDSK